MAPKKRNFMDALETLSDSDGSGSASDDEPEHKTARPSVPKAQGLKVEDLERAGYKSGPSIMRIPEQQPALPEGTFKWSDGKDAKDREEEETDEDRRATRQAVTSGVDQSAFYASKLMQRAEQLKAEQKAEKEAKAKSKNLTFREKEKRKREMGMQSAGKNYVEEEKRIAREFGVYSGFDA